MFLSGSKSYPQRSFPRRNSFWRLPYLRCQKFRRRRRPTHRHTKHYSSCPSLVLPKTCIVTAFYESMYFYTAWKTPALCTLERRIEGASQADWSAVLPTFVTCNAFPFRHRTALQSPAFATTSLSSKIRAATAVQPGCQSLPPPFRRSLRKSSSLRKCSSVWTKAPVRLSAGLQKKGGKTMYRKRR